ncbi:MAG: VOC family protein [Candidatus Levybacteria bacterium]|nr:VOC family protein [Candidatus Levybacteria bacterium]
MVKNLESLLIGSQNATKLAKFYKEKVGLKQSWDAVMGENSNVYGFTIGKMDLVIMDHSDVKGKSKDPARLMFNLEVDNIEKEFAKLKKAGVKVVAKTYHIEEYGYVATFADLDGNYFQLVKTKE